MSPAAAGGNVGGQFAFNHGRSTWSIYVPRGLVRNRRPNPYTGAPGDATFPDYVVILGYAYRLSGAIPSPSRTAPEPSEPRMPGGVAPGGGSS